MTVPPQADPPSVPVQPERPARAIELLASSEAVVGGARVRRALPHRPRRTVGAWCFADHLGPVTVASGPGTEDRGIEVGPHPHIGLQTVTWLTAGELLHRDSLGSEQPIRPGQLNLMTAGHGVSHAEESTGRYSGRLEGIQLWVAQPERTRHGAPAFEHHPELPRYELPAGVVTVLVGASGPQTSPARRDTDHVGAEVLLHGGDPVTLPAETAYEYAVIVLEGAVRLRLRGDAPHQPVMAAPGQLAYLGAGHDEIGLEASGPSRLMLLGGVPFEARVLMWWNFVGRERFEISAARDDWQQGAERFGHTGSPLGRIPAPEVPWRS